MGVQGLWLVPFCLVLLITVLCCIRMYSTIKKINLWDNSNIEIMSTVISIKRLYRNIELIALNFSRRLRRLSDRRRRTGKNTPMAWRGIGKNFSLSLPWADKNVRTAVIRFAHWNGRRRRDEAGDAPGQRSSVPGAKAPQFFCSFS